MSKLLVPIALSSQLDESGEERIHTAAPSDIERIIYPLSVDGDIPDGGLGNSISGTYSAHGGIPPYTFSITSGSMPSGVILNSSGDYSGTFSDEGDFSWVVGCEDFRGILATVNDDSTVTRVWLDGITGTTQSILASALVGDVAIFVGNNTSFRRWENGIVTTMSPSEELGWSSSSGIYNVWHDGTYWWMMLVSSTCRYARSLTGLSGTWSNIYTTSNAPVTRSIAAVDGITYGGSFAGDFSPATIVRQLPAYTSINLGNYGSVTTIRKIGDYVFIGTEYGAILRGTTVANAVPVFNPGGTNANRKVQYISGDTSTGHIVATQSISTQQAESFDGGATWTSYAGISGVIIPSRGSLYRTTATEILRASSMPGPWVQVDSSFGPTNALGSFAVEDGGNIMANTQQGKWAYSAG